MNDVTDLTSKFLRHGDVIILELANLDGCEHGGLLGSELLKSTSKRLINEADIEVVTHSSLAVLPNWRKDDDKYPHSEYLMCCLFEIAAGVGYEAPGEPVNYGAQVQIIHRRSGEYLRARKESNILDLFPREDARDESKVYNFKINPRYLVRKEGDRVMYQDMFVMTDYLGRSVFCSSASKVVVSESMAERTGFRLLSFVQYNEESELILGGDFLQLYHVEDHAFLTCTQRYNSTSHVESSSSKKHPKSRNSGGSNSGSKNSSSSGTNVSSTINSAKSNITVEPLFREIASLERAAGFFQIETIARSSLRMHGAITNSTPVRFRNLLYDQYLTVDGGGYLVLAQESEVSKEETVFELHSLAGLKLDGSGIGAGISSAGGGGGGDLGQSDAGTSIPIGGNVRLYHRATEAYVTMVETTDRKKQRNVTRFGTSSADYDKDVFMLLAADKGSILNVISGKKFLYAFRTLSEKMHYPGLAVADKHSLMRKTHYILDMLTDPLGFLSDIDPDGDGPLQSMFSFSQHVANELGYVPMLLNICAFSYSSPSRSVHKSEEELTEKAYFVLGVLLRRNRAVAQCALDLQGVPQMLHHLTKNRSRNVKWSPPLLQLVDASYATSADSASVAPIQVFTDLDIKFLLDEVSNVLAKDKAPMKFYYQILSRLCRPPEKNIRQFDVEHRSEKVQDMICEQVLGTPEPPDCHGKSPFWSLMVYRTYLDDADAKFRASIGTDGEERGLFVESADNGVSLPSFDLSERGAAGSGLSCAGNPSVGGRGGGGGDLTHHYSSVPRNEDGGRQDSHTASHLPPPSHKMRRYRKRLLVSTSPYGQVRPSTRHENFTPIRPRTVPRELCTDEEWTVAIAVRNSESAMIADRSLFLSQHGANGLISSNGEKLKSKNISQEKYWKIVDATMQAVEWKQLTDLTEEEEEFYCATLDLLSALCHGRNVWTQSVVRKLLPVDHILCALENVDEAILRKDKLKSTMNATQSHDSEISAGVDGGMAHILTSSLDFAHMNLGRFNVLSSPNKRLGDNLYVGNERAIDRDPLTAIKSSLMNVLLDCYIDSGMLPHIQSSGLSSLVQSGKVASTLNVWKDLYADECHGKVFSMISQTNENLIEVSQQMSEEDLKATVAYVSSSPTYRRLNLENEAEFDRTCRSLLGQTHAMMVGTGTVFQFLKRQRLLRQIQFSTENYKSCQQRARLEKIVNDFLRLEALPMWEQGVELPLLKLTAPTIAAATKIKVGKAAGGLKKRTNDAKIVAAAPAAAGSAGNSKLNLLHKGKSSAFNMAITASASAIKSSLSSSNLRAIPPVVQEIRERIQYVLNMLNLLRALVLRGFFEPEYNANPKFLTRTKPLREENIVVVNGVATSRSSRSALAGNGDSNLIPVLEDTAVLVDFHSNQPVPSVGLGAESGDVNAFLDSRSIIREDFFYPEGSPSEDYEIHTVRSSAGNMLNVMDYMGHKSRKNNWASNQSSQYHHAHGGDGSEEEHIRHAGRTSTGESATRQKSNQQRTTDLHRAILNAIEMNMDGDNQSIRPVHDIIQFVLEILRCAPHKRLNPEWMLNEDEKKLEEYFLKQFGFVPDQYGLVSKVVEVKLLCCKILNVCLERIQSKTYETLWEIFSPAFERLKKKKMDELATVSGGDMLRDSMGMGTAAGSGSLRGLIGQFAAKRRLLRRILTLTDRDADLFRDDVYDDLIKIVKRSNDLIWHENSMFTDRAFRTLLYLIHYNSPELRAEAMNLIYHANSRRAQLAGSILQQFQGYRIEDMMALSYLSRQRSLLQQTLGKFRISHPSASTSSSAGRRDNIYDATGSATESDQFVESTGRSPNALEDNVGRKLSAKYDLAQMAARVERAKLVKIFLNTDPDEPLGFINFMFSLHVEKPKEEEEESPSPKKKKWVAGGRSAARRVNFKALRLDMPEESNEDEVGGLTTPPAALGPAPFLNSESAKARARTRGKLLNNISRAFSLLAPKHASTTNKRPAGIGSNSADSLESGLDDHSAHAALTAREHRKETVAAKLQELDDMYDAIQKRHMTNPRHQNLVLSFDVHTIILRFLNRHADSYVEYYNTLNALDDEEDNRIALQRVNLMTGGATAASAAAANGAAAAASAVGSTPLRNDPDAVEHEVVFARCFMCLRAIVKNNKAAADALSTASTVALIFQLRHYSNEAIDLLKDLISNFSGVLAYIGDKEFGLLLDDLLVVVLSASKSDWKSHRHGHNITSCIRMLGLISAIVTSKSDSSINRMNQLMSFLNRKIDTSGRSASAKKRVTEKESSVLNRVLKIALGTEELVENVNFDIKYICREYHRATSRVTFSRFPKDILSDQKIHQNMFAKIRHMLDSWRHLPEESILSFHLKVLSVLADCAKIDSTVRKLLRSLFQVHRSIWDILMIDKQEIKGAYLKLLLGVWFADNQSSSFPPEFLTPDDHIYIRALFYSFSQDLKIFSLAAPEYFLLDSARGEHNLRGQIDQLKAYIVESMLPFLLATLRTNLFEEIDGRQAIVAHKLIARREGFARDADGEREGDGFPSFYEINRDIALSFADIVLAKESFYYILSSDNVATMMQALLEIDRKSYAAVCSEEEMQRIMDAIRLLNKAIFRDHRLRGSGKSRAAAAGQLQSRHAASDATNIAEGLEGVKVSCIQEFLVLIDQYGNKYGSKYSHLEDVHLERLYVQDEEVPIENRSSLPLLSKIDAIMNPLNTKTFVYTMREMSKLVLAFASVKMDARFHDIMRRMRRNKFNYELDIFDLEKQRKMEFASKEPSSLTLGATGKAGGGNFSRSEEIKLYSKLQFLRWSQHGGRILELIIENVLHSVRSFQQRSGLTKLSLPIEELTRCNAYWIDLFTHGLLRTRLKDVDVFYADQTEVQMEELQFESERLSVMQETFLEVNATNLVVHLITVSQESLGANYLPQTFRLIQRMAVNMGIALLENGNHTMQNSLIDAIRDGSSGITKSLSLDFMFAIRMMLRRFDRLFVLEEKIDESSKLEAEKLMRFLVLFCEGHNNNVQSYFGRINVVSEVASFCSEISRVLAKEMQAALVTDEILSPKNQPRVILNQRRSLINWVGKTSSGSKTFVNIDRIALLAKVVFAVLEALSEFTQGPCFENQLIIVRAGSIRDFASFFNFFGAYQLHFREKNAVPLPTTTMEKLWLAAYFDKVQSARTHEGTVGLHDTTSYPCWIGNDPVAVQLMIHRQMKDPSSFIKTKSIFSSIKDSILVGWAATGRFTGLEEEKQSVPESPMALFAGSGDSISGKLGGLSTSFFNFNGVDYAKLDNEDAGNATTSGGGSEGKSASSSSSAFSEDFFLQQKARLKVLESVKEETEDQAEERERNIYYRINEFGETLVNLEAACLKLAGSLLEGAKTDEDLLEIPRTVFSCIGEENLISNMANYWDRYLHYTPIKSRSGSTSKAVSAAECFERQMSYTYYSLVMRLCDLPLATDLKESVDEFILSRMIPIDDHMARIEIRGQDKNALEVVYFPIPSVVQRYWAGPYITSLREEIVFPTNGVGGSRDSAEEKVKSFIKEGMQLIAALRYLDSLDDSAARNPLRLLILSVTRYFNRWALLAFLLSITINMLLIVSVISGPSGNYFVIKGELYSLLVKQLGVVHLGVTSLTALSYTVMYGFLYVKNRQKENPTNKVEVSGFFLRYFAITLNRLYLFGKDTGILHNGQFSVHTWDITLQMVYFLENMESNYYYGLIILSALGRFVHPIWYAFNLVEFLRTFKLMYYVSRAFTQNIDQVIATVVLSALLMYIFTVVSFFTPSLHNDYNFNGFGADGCFSLSSCFRLHLDYSSLQDVLWNYPGAIDSIEGEIFNFLFVFILQIVLPGLVSGIIIDTFSQLREEKLAMEEDVANTCFICNINREDFETANVSFVDHIKREHNMWRYLWWLIYLSEKDPTEFDGTEQFCAELVDADNTPRMLPLKMARALSSVRDKYDLFTIYSKITSLTQDVAKIDATYKSELETAEKAIKDGTKADIAKLQQTMRAHVSAMDKKFFKTKKSERGKKR